MCVREMVLLASFILEYLLLYKSSLISYKITKYKYVTYLKFFKHDNRISKEIFSCWIFSIYIISKLYIINKVWKDKILKKGMVILFKYKCLGY